MIKMTEGGLIDLWPDKSTPEIIALSYALQQGIEMVVRYADQSQCYSGINNLPDQVLDALAVEMRSMYYDQAASIETKRNIIKGTLNWYTHAGTPGAVAELVTAVFGGGDVVEWFDYDEPPFTPWTFDVLSAGKLTDHETFLDMIRKVKNTRSHLRRVVYIREAHSSARAVIRGVTVQESICANYIREDAGAPPQETAAFHAEATETITVMNAGTTASEASSAATIAQIAKPMASTTTVK